MQEFKDRMKVMAFFGEFPYLYGITKPDDTIEVKVRRWDDELLNLWTIGCYEYGEDRVTMQNIIYFLDEHYQVLAIGGRYPETKISLWDPRSWFVEKIRHEQILDSILRLGELASSVKHVVGIHSTLSRKTIAVIYKAPKGAASLKSWVDEHMATAREKLKTCVTAAEVLA